MTFSWGIGKLGAGFAHLGSGGGISAPPTPAILLSSSTIPDTTTSGSLVGTLSVINNTSGTYTYSFLSNPGTLFAISGSNLNTAAAVTVGVKPITIRAAGGVPTPIDQAFAIVVTGTAPLNTGGGNLPTITGTPAVDSVLSKATDGTWSGSPTIVFTYQWNRNGVPIGGATGTSYTLLAADYTALMSLTVIGTNSVGSSSATSANTIAVTGDSTPNAFTFTDATNQPASTVVESDAITVAGINVPAPMTISAGGEYAIGVGSYASAPTTVVATNTVKVRGTSSPTPSGTTNVTLTIGGMSDIFTITTSANVAPSNLTPPSVSGSAIRGSLLTTTNGTWSGTPTPTLTPKWQRDGVTDVGTGTNYITVVADETHTINSFVTASNIMGSLGIASSNTIGPITAPVAPSNSVPPSITGTPQDLQTLTCNPGTWSGTPTPTFFFQWKRSPGEINIGANQNTYQVVTADVGATAFIRCDVTASNTAGSLTVQSNDLGPVIAAGGGTAGQPIGLLLALTKAT